VRHAASSRFWACYHSLPDNIRKLSDERFRLIKSNPQHPSLHLKKTGNFWSVRIGLHYRALAVSIEDGMLWFWIGNHSDYDRLTK
jgi:mRNA-degrading endonuclease RelE of RelBE toxin-antitoxin system